MRKQEIGLSEFWRTSASIHLGPAALCLSTHTALASPLKNKSYLINIHTLSLLYAVQFVNCEVPSRVDSVGRDDCP